MSIKDIQIPVQEVLGCDLTENHHSWKRYNKRICSKDSTSLWNTLDFLSFLQIKSFSL